MPTQYVPQDITEYNKLIESYKVHLKLIKNNKDKMSTYKIFKERFNYLVINNPSKINKVFY